MKMSDKARRYPAFRRKEAPPSDGPEDASELAEEVDEAMDAEETCECPKCGHEFVPYAEHDDA